MIEQRLANLINWIETYHQKKGYGGPVLHYWNNSLDYVGPGYDWRYEGIVIGYLNIYRKTGNKKYLEMAIKAGDELVDAQLPSGNFIHSKFEYNPSFNGGGTPHEASVDIALLELALELLQQGKNWEKYYKCAKKNIDEFYFEKLWDKDKGTFYNSIEKDRFVSNKIATVVEALLLLSNFDTIYKVYAIDTGNYILTQQHENGGIWQSSKKKQIFRLYTARCVPALIKLYKLTKDKRYKKCLDGIRRYLIDYSKVLGAKDVEVIRAKKLLGLGIKRDLKSLEEITNKNGSIRMSRGTYWRAVIGIVGWNAMGLRLYSELITSDLPGADNIFSPFYAEDWKLDETRDRLVVSRDNTVLYSFNKKAKYSTIYIPRSGVRYFGKDIKFFIISFLKRVVYTLAGLFPKATFLKKIYLRCVK